MQYYYKSTIWPFKGIQAYYCNSNGTKNWYDWNGTNKWACVSHAHMFIPYDSKSLLKMAS